MVKDKIKTLRKEENISQDTLANHLYVSRQTISRWESGKSRPTMDNISELANFFDIDTSYFFSEHEEIEIPVKEKRSEFKIAALLKKYWKDICIFAIAISPLLNLWLTPLSYIGLVYSKKQKKKYTFIIGLIALSFSLYFFIALIILLIELLGIGGTTTEIFIE